MEKIDKAIEILQAYKEGKKLEMKFGNGDWFEWNNLPINLFDAGYEYRIKLESTYRPYANASEFKEDFKKHGPWITGCGQSFMPVMVENDRTEAASGILLSNINGNKFHSYEDLLKYYTWDDGTQCGILIKE